jgi:hypothetical protein
MRAALPVLFMVLAAGALLVAISFVWASLRALFGGERERWVTQSPAVRRRGELLDEKESVLRSLKDLEFERDAGKISDEDYRRLEAEFRVRARRILKELDDDLREHRQQASELIRRELAKVDARGSAREQSTDSGKGRA